jgi:hypothetical protein
MIVMFVTLCFVTCSLSYSQYQCLPHVGCQRTITNEAVNGLVMLVMAQDELGCFGNAAGFDGQVGELAVVEVEPAELTYQVGAAGAAQLEAETAVTVVSDGDKVGEGNGRLRQRGHRGLNFFFRGDQPINIFTQPEKLVVA